MPQGQKTSTPVRTEIKRLTMEEGWGPAEIHRVLKRNEELCDDVPDQRTIQRIAKEVRPPDESGVWSVLDADPEQAARVIDVVRWMIIQTEGRTRLTRHDVTWIARVRTVAPEVPPAWALYLAMGYRILSERPNPDSRALDLALGGAPWASAEQGQMWAAACRRCGVVDDTVSDIIDLLESRSKIDPEAEGRRAYLVREARAAFAARPDVPRQAVPETPRDGTPAVPEPPPIAPAS